MHGPRVLVPETDGSPVEPFLALTWNVNGVLRPTSAQAPADARVWSAADNLDAVQAEVLRWRPDAFSLQECRGLAALERFDADYQFLGAHAGHATKAGFVQLYVKKAFVADPVQLSGVPGVAAVVRVRATEVALVALHLANGSDAEGKRLKHLRRALEVATGKSRNVVLLGDMNVGDAELAKVQREPLRRYALAEAAYGQFSWHPQVNRYSDEDGYAQRAPARFDRVLFTGDVYGCAYLVGRRKQFQAGSSFYLSDHFAVMALLDVHSEHGRGDRNLQLEKQRRAALARLRDQAALAEHQGNTEALRVGSEEASLMRQRAADDVQADVDARVRAARNAARRFLDGLRADACGKGSLFADGVVVTEGRPLPAAPSTVAVPGLEGLAAGDGDSVWRHLRANGVGHDGDVPTIGCFASTGNASFLGVAVQVLLRLPAVALWLSQHVVRCDLGRCFVCALWRSRSSLGSGSSAKAPALLEQLEAHEVFDSFRDGRSHPAAGFLRGLLAVASECEESQLRSSDFPGLPGALLTHVDRLFGFVVEQRIGCHACGGAGAVQQRYAARRLLELWPLRAEDQDRVWTTTELCYHASTHREVDAELECARCGGPTVHRAQLRLVTSPNVLFVEPGREAAAGSDRVSTYPVQPGA